MVRLPSDLGALRVEYELAGLAESDLAPDPMAMFTRWFDDTRDTPLLEPNAMVLSTRAVDGGVSARTVLLKEFDERGFVFYTNYSSRKGVELAAEPRCSLLFGWYPLQRQIRVEGLAERVDRAETERYFASRPRAAQLGAWASPQSEPVGSREDLQERLERIEEQFGDGVVPAPPHWGGYRVVPLAVEFWQGRTARLHDRLEYRRGPEGAWATRRLAP